jgi:hypothetical protein
VQAASRDRRSGRARLAAGFRRAGVVVLSNQRPQSFPSRFGPIALVSADDPVVRHPARTISNRSGFGVKPAHPRQRGHRGVPEVVGPWRERRGELAPRATGGRTGHAQVQLAQPFGGAPWPHCAGPLPCPGAAPSMPPAPPTTPRLYPATCFAPGWLFVLGRIVAGHELTRTAGRSGAALSLHPIEHGRSVDSDLHADHAAASRPTAEMPLDQAACKPLLCAHAQWRHASSRGQETSSS